MGESIAEVAAEAEITAGLVEMLTRDHRRMRVAGTALAEAALYTIREHDGLHRLSLAVAAWAKAIADEGDRPHLISQGADHDR